MASFWFMITLYFGGVLSSHPERIVGGHPASIERYPSMVQVEQLSPLTHVWSQNCAGSILTSSFILSAAQCFTEWNLDMPYRRIRAGATYRNTGGAVAYVETAVKHPTYGTTAFEADVCVVRLWTPLSYSATIKQAAILASNSVIRDDTWVVLAGWGHIRAGGHHSHILRDVSVKTINNRLCAERYSMLGLPIRITTNMICAGLLDVGGRDACQGDSGGPMYLDNIVIGVISGGYDCANDTFPGISTSVASYTDWIVDTVYNWPRVY